MKAKSDWLKDKNGSIVAPKTLMGSVYSENGESLAHIAGTGSLGYDSKALLPEYAYHFNEIETRVELTDCIDNYDMLLVVAYSYYDGNQNSEFSVIVNNDSFYKTIDLFGDLNRRGQISFESSNNKTITKFIGVHTDNYFYLKNIYGIRFRKNSSIEVKNYNFSEKERVVGTWIDGRPLYQKTVFVENFRISSSASLDLDIGEVDYIGLIVEGCGLTSLGSHDGFNPFPYVHNNAQLLIGGYFNNSPRATFEFRAGQSSVGNYDIYMSVIYTKPQDSSMSSSSNVYLDYSLDEKVCGTWFDGKPLYQKTYYYDGYINDGWVLQIDPRLEIKEIVNCSVYDTLNNTRMIAPTVYLSAVLLGYYASDGGILFSVNRDLGSNRINRLEMTIRYTKKDR